MSRLARPYCSVSFRGNASFLCLSAHLCKAACIDQHSSVLKLAFRNTRTGSYVCLTPNRRVCVDLGSADLYREPSLVVVEYVPKQVLRATVTYASLLQPDPSASSPSSLATFLNYLRGFRGANVPQSAEKVAIAVLRKHGIMILSAIPSEDQQVCCEFAPGYS